MSGNRILVYGDVPVKVGDVVYIVTCNTNMDGFPTLEQVLRVPVAKADPVTFRPMAMYVVSFDPETVTIRNMDGGGDRKVTALYIFADLKTATEACLIYQTNQRNEARMKLDEQQGLVERLETEIKSI